MNQHLLTLQICLLLTTLTTGMLLHSNLDQAARTHDRSHTDAGQVLESLVGIRHAAMRIVSSTAEYGLLAKAANNSLQQPQPAAAVAEAEIQQQQEVRLIGEGKQSFKQQLDRYRLLVTRLYPGDRPGAERLFYEGNLLRQTASHLLDALGGEPSSLSIIDLKEQFEATEVRFLELADKLIAAERQRAEVMTHRVDSALQGAKLILAAGALLMLVLLGLLHRALKRHSR
ncbi:hypothetical protein [Motiliproteus sediminis]|uniref:hypothetical protein n=1 Tax=Motiliproteus sediminis TaxID=1468178 RepID=UPI001AEF5DA2|nr:hypothetical protein [Motiliproteus sediminis]